MSAGRMFSVEKVPAGAIVVDSGGRNVLPSQCGFVWCDEGRAQEITDFLNNGGILPIRATCEQELERMVWRTGELCTGAPMDRDHQKSIFLRTLQ